MANLEGQWIELFRAGDYGNKGKFTPEDLDAIATSYDPAYHEAPVVIGHPEHDSPAYAWVAGMRREGNVLMGKLRQVQPKLEDLVRSGTFKKRSIALYRNLRRGCGKWYLRHVGFLGGMPPEVKGLADVRLCEFREGRFEAVEVENEGGKMANKILVADAENNRVFLNAGAKLGVKVGDTYAIERLDREVRDPETGEVIRKIMKPIGMVKVREVDDVSAIADVTSGSNFQAKDIATLQATPGAKAAFGEVRMCGRTPVDPISVIFAEAATKRAAQKNISLGEAQRELVSEGFTVKADGTTEFVTRVTLAPGIVLDAESVRRCESAKKRAAERGISFGEALSEIG